MTPVKVKALTWTQTARGPARWEGVSGIGRTYLVVFGESGWIWGIEGGGWRSPAEPSLDDARARCQADWAQAVIEELEQ